MDKTILKIASVAIMTILITTSAGSFSNAYAIWGHGISYRPSLGGGDLYQYSDGLKINGKTFDVSKPIQSIPTQVILVGAPNDITLKLSSNSGPKSIQHVVLFLNVRGNSPLVQKSDTWITWDKYSGVTWHDPHNLITNVTAKVSFWGHFLYLTLELTPATPMNTSDLIIRAWDYRYSASQTTVLGAVEFFLY